MRCNRQKLAALLDKDVKTIDKMVEKGMPYVSRPGVPPGQREWVFDTRKVIRWMAGKSHDDHVIEEMAAARIRIMAAEADLKEIEYLEKLGVLHRVDDVIPEFEEALHISKSLLLDMPGRLALHVAHETDPNKIKAMLQREVDLINAPLTSLIQQWSERGKRDRKIMDGLPKGLGKPPSNKV